MIDLIFENIPTKIRESNHDTIMADRFYPPLSIKMIIDMLLNPTVKSDLSNTILFYFLLDVLDTQEREVKDSIDSDSFDKFASSLGVTKRFVDYAMACWHLDNGHCKEAVQIFLSSSCYSPGELDVREWKNIVYLLLSFGCDYEAMRFLDAPSPSRSSLVEHAEIMNTKIDIFLQNRKCRKCWLLIRSESDIELRQQQFRFFIRESLHLNMYKEILTLPFNDEEKKLISVELDQLHDSNMKEELLRICHLYHNKGQVKMAKQRRFQGKKSHMRDKNIHIEIPSTMMFGEIKPESPIVEEITSLFTCPSIRELSEARKDELKRIPALPESSPAKSLLRKSTSSQSSISVSSQGTEPETIVIKKSLRFQPIEPDITEKNNSSGNSDQMEIEEAGDLELDEEEEFQIIETENDPNELVEIPDSPSPSPDGESRSPEESYAIALESSEEDLDIQGPEPQVIKNDVIEEKEDLIENSEKHNFDESIYLSPEVSFRQTETKIDTPPKSEEETETPPKSEEEIEQPIHIAEPGLSEDETVELVTPKDTAEIKPDEAVNEEYPVKMNGESDESNHPTAFTGEKVSEDTEEFVVIPDSKEDQVILLDSSVDVNDHDQNTDGNESLEIIGDDKKENAMIDAYDDGVNKDVITSQQNVDKDIELNQSEVPSSAHLVTSNDFEMQNESPSSMNDIGNGLGQDITETAAGGYSCVESDRSDDVVVQEKPVIPEVTYDGDKEDAEDEDESGKSGFYSHLRLLYNINLLL